MAYSLAEAGAAIGMSKSSVLRAIRKGTISAERDATTGRWAIDPAELHRVFPPVLERSERSAETIHGTMQNGDGPGWHDGETVAFRELRARLEDAHRTIDDLRRRLDTEAEERRRLTAVLADRSTPPPMPARRWWPWGRRVP